MATKKRVPKRAAFPGWPENPRAEPGTFVVRGKAWFDEHGDMIIDERGDIEDDEEDFVRYGDFLYKVGEYRENDRIPRGTRASYELRWCPVARKPKKPRKTVSSASSAHLSGTTESS
jgi:hypothetical protein